MSNSDLDPITGAASLSPKERVFTNYDVLLRIFTLFVQGPNLSSRGCHPRDRLSVDGRKQLFNLALVCKDFTEPALICLWSHMESLIPLFKLHPAFQVLEGRGVFLGDLKGLGSNKFHEYCRRVRTIHFKNKSDDDVLSLSHAGCAWLGQQLQSSPLLPGIQSIHFSATDSVSEVLGILPLIASPSIERVEFCGLHLSSLLFRSHTLPLVCDAAPSFKHVTLHDKSPSPLPDIWGIFARMPTDLQSLDICFPRNLSIETTFLGQVSLKFHNLSSLTLDVHTSSHGPSEEFTSGRLTLPALTSLHLTSQSQFKLCACYPAFLIHKATWITFHLTETALSENSIPADTLEALSSIQSLKQISVEANDDSVLVNAAAMSPFLERVNLEEFVVNSWGLRYLTSAEPGNEQIKSLIDAAATSNHLSKTYRRLRFLSFPIWRFAPQTYTLERGRRVPTIQPPLSYPPIECLLYIARHAKGVEHISLSIDSASRNGKTLKAIIQSWEESENPSHLRYLEIADMRSAETPFSPGEYGEIARLLDAIFPNLVSVTMVEHPARKKVWDEHWRVIEENREMYKLLRLHGSKRW